MKPLTASEFNLSLPDDHPALESTAELMKAYARHVIESLTDEDIFIEISSWIDMSPADEGAKWARQELLNRVK